MKVFTKIVLVLLITGQFHSLIAQNLYSTQKGNIEVYSVLPNLGIHLLSNDLKGIIDYEDATYELQVDISTFRTGVDSLDEILANVPRKVITLVGNFGLNYINTEGHPPLDFITTGVLSTSNIVIEGRGHLEHLTNQGLFSCVLTIHFEVIVEDLGFELLEISPDDNVHIDITQIVMNRIEDQ